MDPVDLFTKYYGTAPVYLDDNHCVAVFIGCTGPEIVHLDPEFNDEEGEYHIIVETHGGIYRLTPDMNRI